MLQLGSLFTLSPRASENSPGQSRQQTLPEFVLHIRKVTGLSKENVYCNLRLPDQFQAIKDDISIILVAGQGLYCIDVKLWRGKVSAHNLKWHIQVQERDQCISNTSIEQTEDPLKAILEKTANVCGHLRRNGVSVHQNQVFPKVVFLSEDCQLDEELEKKTELIPHNQIDSFLRSLQAGYIGWISDALTPSWLSGHLSYRQMESVRGVLKKVGTWDLMQLRSGEQLRGDYQGCQYIAVNRQDTDILEFSGVKTLSTDSLWALLGHNPQVTAKLYKRGSPGWLGKTVTASTTISSSTFVVFKISGEEADSKIPAGSIHSITLSI
ncbi:uncharacterized protein si:zfos-911d5.4 [Synchiropus splendidus]|uniref:uncharacterized protein si:zfos-911d5.4 n=1 Tax=Synchiropus splendidus TaxID=270530 RepID=UPI00237E48EA|nr:uncharacterized protein si:zfos-911d5.4 [Synchiropus splendidus]